MSATVNSLAHGRAARTIGVGQYILLAYVWYAHRLSVTAAPSQHSIDLVADAKILCGGPCIAYAMVFDTVCFLHVNCISAQLVNQIAGKQINELEQRQEYHCN